MPDQHELRDKGLRLTPQRELVLAAVRALEHATPEEVAERVKPSDFQNGIGAFIRHLRTGLKFFYFHLYLICQLIYSHLILI
jgi:Fur family ferric uptake transcriptional regulator